MRLGVSGCGLRHLINMKTSLLAQPGEQPVHGVCVCVVYDYVDYVTCGDMQVHEVCVCVWCACVI